MRRVGQVVSIDHIACGKQSRSLASYNKQLLVRNTECHSLDEEEGHFGTMYSLNLSRSTQENKKERPTTGTRLV